MIRSLALTICLLGSLPLFADGQAGGLPSGLALGKVRVGATRAVKHAGDNASADDHIVVPGVRLGGIQLGRTNRSEAHKTLGSPARSRVRKDGLREETWEHGPMPELPTEKFFVTILLKRNRVVQAETNLPSYKTENGISTATTFAQIHKRLPRLKVTEHVYNDLDARRLHFDDVAKGIAFYVTAQDEVFSDAKPEAVIVHLKGSPVIRRPGGVADGLKEMDKTRMRAPGR